MSFPQLKIFIDSQVQNSTLGECKKEPIKKCVDELSQEMFVQLKSQCLQGSHQEVLEQVNNVLGLLLPPDFTPKVGNYRITSKKSNIGLYMHIFVYLSVCLSVYVLVCLCM